MPQEIPILEFDPDPSAMLEPSKLISRNEAMPSRCVICFFNDVIGRMLAEDLLTEIACLHSEIGRHPIYAVNGVEPGIAIFHPGIGAPLAAGMLEEVIALGADKFIACGGAGTLDGNHHVGKLIVPTAAIRDEGTSYHYLPPSQEVEPSAAALSAIQQALTDAGAAYELTKTWTTDAIYRETKSKIARRRAEGCGSVEMEAAALFAVAKFRGVELAQILYAGDDLSGELWDSRQWQSRVEVREELVRLAMNACALI
jgi:uridine phosphorylase